MLPYNRGSRTTRSAAANGRRRPSAKALEQQATIAAMERQKKKKKKKTTNRATVTASETAQVQADLTTAPSPPEIYIQSSLSILPSSPPVSQSSPPPGEVNFVMDITYQLRVNGISRVSDKQSISREDFLADEDLDERMTSMAAQPLSTVDGRETSWQGVHVGYKVLHNKSSWQYITLANCSFAEFGRLFHHIDQYIVRFNKPIRHIDFKIEFHAKVDALQKAMPRGRSANEPSSDPQPDIDGGPRTRILLRQSRAERQARTEERVEDIRQSIDHRNLINKHWECRESLCQNFGRYCWVHSNDHFYYEIKPNVAESWARSIIDEESFLQQPSTAIVNALQLRPNILKVNPNNRRKRQGSTPSSDEHSNAQELKKIKRQVEQHILRSQINRMTDEEALWVDRRDLQLYKMQQAYGHGNNPTGIPPSPYAGPQYPQPAVLSANVVHPSSSPIAASGTRDGRRMLREFFTWAIEYHSDDPSPYYHAEEVAKEQLWTMDDLYGMSDMKSDLYRLAVDTYKIRDGLVRHLRKDLRMFKAVYRERVANYLLNLQGTG
jgi:hypothetical protein